MAEPLKFVDNKNSQFFSTVKKRVDAYFKENNLSKHANNTMVFKTILLLSTLVILYLIILLQWLPIYLQLLLSILMGITMALIGFNVAHDAIHGAYSSNKRINKILGLSFNVIGANAYIWNIMHNQVHHTYTNISGHDDDIELANGLVQLSPHHKKNRLQKYQHIYAFALYGLTTLSWFFRKDFYKFFKKNIGSQHYKHPRIEYFNLFFYKFLYYALFIVIPFLLLDITWWQFLLGYFIMNFIEGLVLGLVFQLAHMVQETEIVLANPDNTIQDAWAEHQMRTTADFATPNKWISYLTGGLNMQIEHHLFPKICHTHYPKISHIIRQTAHEFNLPYHENKTFASALKSHYLFLKNS